MAAHSESGGRRPRTARYHRSVAALLALGVLILPLVEIYVLVLFAHAFGVLNTIALLVVCSVVGVWLARHQGFWVLARIRDSVAAGRMPTNDLIDGGLVPGMRIVGVVEALLLPAPHAAVND